MRVGAVPRGLRLVDWDDAPGWSLSHVEGSAMTFFLWMVSIVLIVAGIYFLLQRQWIYAAVAILVGALIGPIGVSLIK